MNRLLLAVAVAPVFTALLGTVIAVTLRLRLGGGRSSVERLAPALYAATVTAAALLAAGLTGFDPVRLGLTGRTAPALWLVAVTTAGGVLAGVVGYFTELLLAHRALTRTSGARPAAEEFPGTPEGGAPLRGGARVPSTVREQGGAQVPGDGGEGMGGVGGATGAAHARSGARAPLSAPHPAPHSAPRGVARPPSAGARSLGAWTGRPRALLALGLLTGLAEEVLFRGYLLTGLRHSLALWAALALQAAVFAVHHASFGLRAVPAKAVHGLVWGALTIVSGSLLPALAAHGVFQVLVCRRLTRLTNTHQGPTRTQEGGAADDRAHGPAAVRRPPLAR